MNPTPSLRRHLDRFGIARGGVSVLVWGVYGAACLVPTMYVELADQTWAGWKVLRHSWLPPFCAAGSANFWLGLGWIFFVCGHYAGATLFAWIAVVAAALTWVMGFSLLEGYYLWQTSTVILAVAATVLLVIERRGTLRRSPPAFLPPR
jgi:hypothetical protein